MFAQTYLMAIGAGLASAVLFVLPAKGYFAAILLGLAAPLPLMIVALADIKRSAWLATLVAVVGLAAGFDVDVAGAYVLSVVGPSLALAFLATRHRTGAPGDLLFACAGWASFVACAGLLLEAWSHGSAEAVFDDIAQQAAPLADQLRDAVGPYLQGVDASRLARWFALAVTPAAAGWGVIGLAINLWLAGRATEISGLLPRPWPDLPSSLRLSRFAFAALGVALLLCLAPGAARVMAASVATGLMVAFALSGLAALHGLTRGRSSRPVILGSFYALCLALFPWPLVLAAGLGLADVARPLRRAPAPSNQPT